MNLGEKIDRIYELREQKREFESRAKELGAKIDELKGEVRQELDDMGTHSLTATRAQAIVTEQTVPKVTDWDALRDYIRDNEYEHLFQRRINSAAYKELVDMGEEVPGVEPFVKRDVAIRVRR